MKKLITICFLVVVTTTTSFTKCYSQSNEFPPIQKFLDNVNGKKFVTSGVSEKNKMLSQTISKNAFTKAEESSSSGKIYKSVMSNIDWRDYFSFSFYSVRETKKIIQCEFEFLDEINYTLFANNQEFSKGSERRFSCYILEKDKEEFRKVMEEWKKSSKK